MSINNPIKIVATTADAPSTLFFFIFMQFFRNTDANEEEHQPPWKWSLQCGFAYVDRYGMGCASYEDISL